MIILINKRRKGRQYNKIPTLIEADAVDPDEHGPGLSARRHSRQACHSFLANSTKGVGNSELFP
jgi:hypothetical protein